MVHDSPCYVHNQHSIDVADALGPGLVRTTVGEVSMVSSRRRPATRLSGMMVRVCAALFAMLTLVATVAVLGDERMPAANAWPCPDGTQTCGPQPTQGPEPTQGPQTTAPQAPQTTIPPNVDTGLPSPTQSGNGPTLQGTVQAMPTPDPTQDGCIVNCSTGTPSPTTTGPVQPTTTAARPSPTQSQTQQECTSASNAGAVRDGVVRYKAPAELLPAIENAAGAWKGVGAPDISAVSDGSSPTVEIQIVSDRAAGWQGLYVAPVGNRPAQILLNTAIAGPVGSASMQRVVAHELGHAIGLLDTSNPTSLMGINTGRVNTPQPADVQALQQVGVGGVSCGPAAPATQMTPEPPDWFPGWGSLTPAEKEACMASYFSCSRLAVGLVREKSWRQSQQAFPDRESSSEGGRQDAARHCIWQALSAYIESPATAAMWGDAHEKDNPAGTDPVYAAAAENMDQLNNVVGRNIGIRAKGMARPRGTKTEGRSPEGWIYSTCISLAKQAIFFDSNSASRRQALAAASANARSNPDRDLPLAYIKEGPHPRCATEQC